MNVRHFLRIWVPMTLVTGLASAGAAYALGLERDGWLLSLALWGLFSSLTLVAAWGSLRAMDDRDFPRFQSYFMGSLMGKILLTGLIMGIYAYTTEHKTTAVLLPVGLSYLPFLLLETLYLSKASREKGPYPSKKQAS
ncbi:MAG: hypothetical protein GC205_02980 [Bacteroidetes bacterium]|nr:hypothetical protein [Bacteroidota bacterium]